MPSMYQVAPHFVLQDTQTLISMVLFIREAGGGITIRHYPGIFHPCFTVHII